MLPTLADKHAGRMAADVCKRNQNGCKSRKISLASSASSVFPSATLAETAWISIVLQTGSDAICTQTITELQIKRTQTCRKAIAVHKAC